MRHHFLLDKIADFSTVATGRTRGSGRACAPKSLFSNNVMNLSYLGAGAVNSAV
jgi:hypothetical protein